jgi:hypothetical protein
MPSNERVQRAFEILAGRATSFRAALSAARDEMREHLVSHRSVERDRAQAAMQSLGPFASGRIDTKRFGALLTDERALPPASAAQLAQCAHVLDELLARGDALFVHRVPSGGLLRGRVEAALAYAGRAFAAARVFQAVRRGAPTLPASESILGDFPFSYWSRAERDLAPPLVVEINGADLRAEHLVEFLDGGVCIALVVREPAPPAPLVRLVAPGVLVLQSSDASQLERLGRATTPAVAALMPHGCAELLHDPRGGTRLEERLSITLASTPTTCEALGWRSARQVRDEVAQLEALSELCRAARDVSVVVAPPLPAGSAQVNGSGAVDVVASWMLAQAGFATGGGGAA